MRVFNAEPWNEAWTVESARLFLHDLLETPRALGVLALAEDKPVGFILGHSAVRDTSTQFYISEMCVLTKFQGQGLGRGLMKELEATLNLQDVGKIYLLTARGGAAEAFYHACGFYTSERMVMLGKYL